MKQGLNSSSTKSYPQQLVVARTTWNVFQLPKYFWVVTVILAMALLCSAAVLREREGRRNAQTANQFVKNQLEQVQLTNTQLRKDIKAARQDKEVISREAQNTLGYLRPNEIVVVVK